MFVPEKPRPQKVLFAGTPGVQKGTALQNLRRTIRRLYPDQDVFVLPDGDVPIMDKIIYGPNPNTFLRSSEHSQKERWKEGFDEILPRFAHQEDKHQFLGVHLTLRYRGMPTCPVSFLDLVAWRPDIIITFVDDLYSVRQRIHMHGHPIFTLPELLLWRAEEILLADLLARVVDLKEPPPNYVVAVKHPAETLARLIIEHDTVARVYISHRITETRDLPGRRRVIDTFRKKIRQHKNLVVFEPLTIDELPPAKRWVPDPREPKKKMKVSKKQKAPSKVASALLLLRKRTYDRANPDHRWPNLDPTVLLEYDPQDTLPTTFPLRGCPGTC